jgi:hypothetical protein
MNRNFNFVFFAVIVAFFYVQTFAVVDGTTGTPLGGVGSGSVKFCAHSGAFYSVETTPCALKDFQILTGANFQLYTNRGTAQVKTPLTAVVTNGKAADDAIYPIDTAYMGNIDNVTVSLLAFSPISFDSIPLMCLPYAFFEFKVTNTASTAVDAAVAFQIPTGSVPVFVAGKGIQSTGANALNRAVYASSTAAGAIISAGADNGFSTAGQCNNTPSGNLNKVSVKVSLAAQASATIRFVYAWYNGATITSSGYNIGPDRLYYTNLVTDAGSVADIGLAQFDRLRTNALQIATRMRGSNIPDWIKDQTLNSLCNLTTNTIYTKDGRHCFTEGEWNTNGTMDQMWHAREIMTMTVPSLAWKELEWWARTQKTDTAAGQIHHDMGAPAEKLWGWEQDANHPEYDYQPNCNPWVDLNIGFIVSVYEAYIATGDKTKLDFFWPYLKKAAQRILNQVKIYGNKQYPYTFETSLNTYDQPSNNLNPFNGGLSSSAYKIMTILADLYGETALKTTYQNAFDTSKISFQDRYLNNNFPTETRFIESIMAGQWLSFYLKFGQLYSKTAIDFGLSKAEAHYQGATKGLAFTARTYEEWAPYLLSHYGGLCLQTGKLNIWRSMQYDWYQRCYLDRNLVFNQPLDIPAMVITPKYLATDPSAYYQYISIPVLWRNYYSIIGYHRNKPAGELWLEPILPTEMNHTMQNAFYMSPEGFGNISYTEIGTNYRSQLITFKPDKPVEVSSLYLWDKASDSVEVKINGQKKPFTRIGQDYAKELKVDFNGTVGTSGITISVLYGADTSSTYSGYGKHLRMPLQSTILTCISNRVVFPQQYNGMIKLVTVYSIKGARIYRAIVKKESVDLHKDFGIPEGTYIVKVGVR